MDVRIHPGIEAYHSTLPESERAICDRLATAIHTCLADAEQKIWHGHPVWFLDGNPIVGYSKQKAGIRLMFWSGASFGDKELGGGTGKFKDASIFYNAVEEVDEEALKRWLKLAQDIQWDYKNLVKRKGRLERLK